METEPAGLPEETDRAPRSAVSRPPSCAERKGVRSDIHFADDVVVVAARSAYPEYLKESVYICQAGRTLRKDVNRIGFYADQQIKPEIAHIEHRRDNVVFSRSQADSLSTSVDPFDRRIAKQILRCISDGSRAEDQPQQIFLLSAADGDATETLALPIQNDTQTASGKAWAWTVGQRYTNLAALKKVGLTKTSGLNT